MLLKILLDTEAFDDKLPVIGAVLADFGNHLMRAEGDITELGPDGKLLSAMLRNRVDATIAMSVRVIDEPIDKSSWGDMTPAYVSTLGSGGDDFRQTKAEDLNERKH